MEYKFDVKGKTLGRAAAKAATILRGKDSVDFAPNKLPDIKLSIENVDGLNVTGEKMKQKKYIRHSGYPGSLKTTVLEKLIVKKGMKYVFEKAVNGMLPKNKLRKQAMKNLIIK